MSSYPINLMIQVVGGFLGGNVVGGVSKSLSLDVVGNSFIGVFGGAAAGQLVFHVLMPVAARPDGIMVLGEALVSALAGAALTALVGMYKPSASEGTTMMGSLSSGGPTLGKPNLREGTSLPWETLRK